MKSISVHELRGKSAQVWRDLAEERELVITRNGKPIAIVSATDEEHFEQSLQELRQTRAMRAAKELQERSIESGRDQLTTADTERDHRRTPGTPPVRISLESRQRFLTFHLLLRDLLRLVE